jgi:hypothetical protein
MYLLIALSLFPIDSHLEKIKSYYNSWHAHALKVHSGIVEISGEEKIAGEKEAKVIRIRIAFDTLQKKEFINWDWSGQRSGVWSRNPKSLTYMEPDGGIINIVSPDQKPLPFIKPFDLRYLPLATNAHLKNGFQSNELWKEIETILGSNFNFRVTELPDRNTCEFVREEKKSLYEDKVRMDVDFSRGATPVILGITYKVMRKNNSDWTEVSSSLLKYENVNGVSIPIEVITSDKSAKSDVKLNLKWTRINDPIEDFEFDVKNFPIQKSALLIDSRISRDKPITLGTIEPTVLTPLTADEASRISMKTKLLILLFILVTLASVGYVFVRRTRVRSDIKSKS